MDDIGEPSNRAITLTSAKRFAYIHNNMYRSGTSSITLLEDDQRMIAHGYVFKPYSPFYETFNAKIGLLNSNGVLPQIEKDYLNPLGFTRHDDEIGPQVLTLDHLGVAFLISLCPLLTATLVFLCEVFVPSRYLKVPAPSRYLKEFWEGLIISCAIRAYFRIKSYHL